MLRVNADPNWNNSSGAPSIESPDNINVKVTPQPQLQTHQVVTALQKSLMSSLVNGDYETVIDWLKRGAKLLSADIYSDRGNCDNERVFAYIKIAMQKVLSFFKYFSEHYPNDFRDYFLKSNYGKTLYKLIHTNVTFLLTGIKIDFDEYKLWKFLANQPFFKPGADEGHFYNEPQFGSSKCNFLRVVLTKKVSDCYHNDEAHAFYAFACFAYFAPHVYEPILNECKEIDKKDTRKQAVKLFEDCYKQVTERAKKEEHLQKCMRASMANLLRVFPLLLHSGVLANNIKRPILYLIVNQLLSSEVFSPSIKSNIFGLFQTNNRSQLMQKTLLPEMKKILSENAETKEYVSKENNRLLNFK